MLFVNNCKYDRVYNALFDQLVRSATSISADIIERKAGDSKRYWKKFFVIALKSANETKYWLCLIRDTMKIDIEQVKKLPKEAQEISNIIATIIINSAET